MLGGTYTHVLQLDMFSLTMVPFDRFLINWDVVKQLYEVVRNDV